MQAWFPKLWPQNSRPHSTLFSREPKLRFIRICSERQGLSVGIMPEWWEYSELVQILVFMTEMQSPCREEEGVMCLGTRLPVPGSANAFSPITSAVFFPGTWMRLLAGNTILIIRKLYREYIAVEPQAPILHHTSLLCKSIRTVHISSTLCRRAWLSILTGSCLLIAGNWSPFRFPSAVPSHISVGTESWNVHLNGAGR